MVGDAPSLIVNEAQPVLPHAAGASAIIVWPRLTRESGKSVSLAQVTDHARRVLQIADLDLLIASYRNVREASARTITTSPASLPLPPIAGAGGITGLRVTVRTWRRRSRSPSPDPPARRSQQPVSNPGHDAGSGDQQSQDDGHHCLDLLGHAASWAD